MVITELSLHPLLDGSNSFQHVIYCPDFVTLGKSVTGFYDYVALIVLERSYKIGKSPAIISALTLSTSAFASSDTRSVRGARPI